MSSPRSNPSSSAAAPLDDEDLLSEILLRLPPQPSSLPRASAVCKLWRSLASDPGFSRRFRTHHRRNPPLLGCFVQDLSTVHFEPMLEAPNRVSQARFSFPIDAGDYCRPIGCRHGLALIFHPWRKLLVWDPITGNQHRLDIPLGFNREIISGAVLRAAGEVHHFQVVLVGSSDIQHTQAVASVYSSETSVWSSFFSTPLPADDPTRDVPTEVYPVICSVMVGSSLYWFLYGNWFGILEFNLDRQSLSVIHVPVDVVDVDNCLFTVMPAEGGGLGFLFLSGYCAQLWKRKTDGDGVASWVMGRTVALDKLLSMNSEEGSQSPRILGFAEDNNAVLLWTFMGVFMVQFESLQFKKLFESQRWFRYYPFEGVYTTDARMGGGHGGAKLLRDT